MNLVVEGWRFVPHSYAFVNHAQCAELARRPGVSLYHVDAPYANPAWRPLPSLVSPESDALVRSLAPPPPGLVADAWLSIHAEYRVQPVAAARRTFTFGTCEYGIVPPPALGLSATQAPRLAGAGVAFITPSNWSRQGFLRCGAPAERVAVVPHGVDTSVFRPADEAERRAERAAMGIDASFIFLHVGAMTWNKGVDVLLPAFAAVLERHPGAALILKGTDLIYGSRNAFRAMLDAQPPAARARLAPRIHYLGHPMPAADLARLHRAADAYVCPYRGEGFNLPALEAAASGLPVICTAGGPTDDFILPAFGRRVRSEQRRLAGGQPGFYLQPSIDNLVRQMLFVADDPAFREQARHAGPAHVRAHYTWPRVVDRLLDVLAG
jgi:glycosyltransferase involved in cell wall biosynthesis